MDQKQPTGAGPHARVSKLPHRFGELLHKLLSYTQQDLSRSSFVYQSCETIMDVSGCDALEVRIDEHDRTYRYRCWAERDGTIRRDSGAHADLKGHAKPATGGPLPDSVLDAVLHGDFTAAAPFLTRSGSFWTGDAARPILLREKAGRSLESRTVVIGGEFQSLALIPFPVSGHVKGVLQLGSRRRDFFTKNDVQLYEAVAETLGVALAHQRAQWAVRERVKELTCLYGVAKATQNPGRAVDDLFRDIMELIPHGWQYPEITSTRIVFDGRPYTKDPFSDRPWKQVAALVVDGVRRGTIEVAYAEERPEADEGPFLKEERSLLEAVAETLGVALAHQSAQWALRERVKEITCLYGIAKAMQSPGQSAPDFLHHVVELLPPAWQYPELTSACITLDKQFHATAGFQQSPWRQSAEILVQGVSRGVIEVCYAIEKPAGHEGPFLKEERSLINEVARQVGLMLDRMEAEKEKSRLQEQLRHADRLATIGQLAAGAAHELNEPLGSILGFAQLAKSCPNLPSQAEQDVTKIINAALHAREVIRKLLHFSRQMPTHKAPCDLNHLVREGLYFLESRCEREGIRLVRQLDDTIPEITADAAQLHQVLVNLVVNAIQAMPHGGTLTIKTALEDDRVLLAVDDTGIGMTDAVKKQLFIPFFTTKGVGHGTGLGLSVVHGIVTSHGGTICVTSQHGEGSHFEVSLPLREAARSKENT
jgi:signal transduction histidine kinase